MPASGGSGSADDTSHLADEEETATLGMPGYGKTPKVYFLKRKGFVLLTRESGIPPELIGTHKETSKCLTDAKRKPAAPRHERRAWQTAGSGSREGRETRALKQRALFRPHQFLQGKDQPPVVGDVVMFQRQGGMEVPVHAVKLRQRVFPAGGEVFVAFDILPEGGAGLGEFGRPLPREGWSSGLLRARIAL